MTRHREKPSKRKNPSGRTVWEARYTNRDGKRQRTTNVLGQGTFDTRGPCRDESPDGLCCAQHAIDKAYELEAAGPARHGKTVKAYAAEWFRTHPRSERTDATNEHRLQVVLGPFTPSQIAREKRDVAKGRKPRTGVVLEGVPLGDWQMADLRPRHGDELLAVLLIDQGRAAAGAKNLLLTLSAMFTDAIRDEHAILNPWTVRVRAADPRVKKKPRKPRVVSFEEMHRLAAAAGEYEPMVRIAADCGLRLGELLGMWSDDVKLGSRCDELTCEVEGPHLHVRRTAHDGDIEEGTKRERMRGELEGGRVVPLPLAVAAMVKALPRRLPGKPMWFGTSGLPWREDTFRNDVWNPARASSGVQISPQDARHSWVTNLRAAGVDEADLAEMGGHSVEVATATYTHALRRSYGAVRRAVGE